MTVAASRIVSARLELAEWRRRLYNCMMAQMSKKVARTKTRRIRRCDLGTIIEPRFFKALGDPNRIALLSGLARGARPCSVSELTCCCPVDVSVVSRHLAILRDAGIVHAQRRGKSVFYSVRFDTLSASLRHVADAIEACCRNPNKENV